MLSRKGASVVLTSVVGLFLGVGVFAATVDQKTDFGALADRDIDRSARAISSGGAFESFHINTHGAAPFALHGLGQEPLSVPLPGGLVLMGTMLAGLGVMHRRRQRG